MLFMVIEHFRPGRAADVYRRFHDQGRMAPDGLRYVSSWVDMGFQRCFQVMDADDEVPLHEWMSHWRDVIAFKVIAVRTSKEAATAIAPQL